MGETFEKFLKSEDTKKCSYVYPNFRSTKHQKTQSKPPTFTFLDNLMTGYSTRGGKVAQESHVYKVLK